MPSIATTVGLQEIPYPVGAPGSPVEDRAAVVLADYLAFWLRFALDDKLADLGGDRDNTLETYTSACPSANIYPYDPKDVWPRNRKPALYLWWGGTGAKRNPKTVVYDLRERELQFVWIYSQITSPSSGASRSGLAATVDAVLRRAERRGRHPGWSHGDYPAGSLVSRAAGLHEWQIARTEPGAFAPVVSGQRSEGQAQNFYPVVRGAITVWERVYDDVPEAPDDLNVDPLLTIGTNEEGDFLDPLDVVSVFIPRPIGR